MNDRLLIKNHPTHLVVTRIGVYTPIKDAKNISHNVARMHARDVEVHFTDNDIGTAIIEVSARPSDYPEEHDELYIILHTFTSLSWQDGTPSDKEVTDKAHQIIHDTLDGRVTDYSIYYSKNIPL